MILIILLSLFTSNCSANYGSPYNFSVELLLNKPDLTYDLSPLREYNESDGSVKIFNIEDKNDDIFDTVQMDEMPVDTNMNQIPIDDVVIDVNWPPGEYYLYRSHQCWDIAVLIREVKVDSESELLDHQALSISFIIPTEFSRTAIERESRSLELEYHIEIDPEIIEFVSGLGYNLTDTQMITPEFSNLIFLKDDVILTIISINESATTPRNTPLTMLTLDGPKGKLPVDTDKDMKDILTFLNLAPELWDNATSYEHEETEYEYFPSLNFDIGYLNWTEIISTELIWLINESVLSGLTETDLDHILQNTENINSSLNPTISSINSTWRISFIPEWSDGFGENAQFRVNSGWIPPLPPGDGLTGPTPHPVNGTNPSDIYGLPSIITASIVIVLLVLFSYTRIKRRSILDNLNRKNIFEFIKSNQGVHFKKILRELDFQPGALSYHLNVLEKGEFIKSIQDGNLRRFYLFGAKSDFKIALTTIQLRILSIVDNRPGISQAKISEIIGRNKMVINYHIKILNDANLISLEKEGRISKVFTTGNAGVYLS